MISCMLFPEDENFDKFFQVRPVLDHLKRKTFTLFWWLINIYSILMTLYQSLLKLQEGEFTVWVQCVKVFCKAAVWPLVKSWKKIGEVYMMKKNALTVSMRCHKCQVHVCIGRTKNVYGIFTSKDNIDLCPTLCKISFHLVTCKYFMVLEIKWEVELGYLQRGCWGLKSGKAECGKM